LLEEELEEPTADPVRNALRLIGWIVERKTERAYYVKSLDQLEEKKRSFFANRIVELDQDLVDLRRQIDVISERQIAGF